MPKLCRLTIKMTIFGVYRLKNKLGHSETLVDPIDNTYTGRKITIHSISSCERALSVDNIFQYRKSDTQTISY